MDCKIWGSLQTCFDRLDGPVRPHEHPWCWHPGILDFLAAEEQTEPRNIQNQDSRRTRARELREIAIVREKSRRKDNFPISDITSCH